MADQIETDFRRHLDIDIRALRVWFVTEFAL